jgi:phosphatidylglycerol:prolipoprotein diacylglycerol transferase
MAIIGVLAAFALCRLLVEKENSAEPGKTSHWSEAFIFSLSFGVAGAFTLKPVVRLAVFLFRMNILADVPLKAILTTILGNGEIVFYGGLLGGLLGLLLYCRIFRRSLLPYINLAAPGIAAGHAFGRMGCFLGGCCYGRETHYDNPFAVTFPKQADIRLAPYVAPPGIPRLPVQLFESAFLFLLCIVLCVVYRKVKHIPGICAAIYMFAYGVWRFIIEFWRGDTIRGYWAGFSTSQWISVLCVVIASVILIACKRGFANITETTEAK